MRIITEGLKITDKNGNKDEITVGKKVDSYTVSIPLKLSLKVKVEESGNYSIDSKKQRDDVLNIDLDYDTKDIEKQITEQVLKFMTKETGEPLEATGSFRTIGFIEKFRNYSTK